MRIREEAKRQGAVLSYERISNARLLTPGRKLTDPISIVLMTEYACLSHAGFSRTTCTSTQTTE